VLSAEFSIVNCFESTSHFGLRADGSKSMEEHKAIKATL